MHNKERIGLVRLCWIVALVVSSFAGCANSQTQSTAPVAVGNAANAAAPVHFAAYTRVLLFLSSTGQWMPATFERALPGNEFFSNNQLYRVVDSDKAQLVANVDAGKLVEADLPYDRTSHRPGASDVVQVLGKDMRFTAHAVLSTVQPGATVRFQGKAYNVRADRTLADTGKVFTAETSALQRIGITASALQHIVDRHTAGGTANTGKSIFNAGQNIGALIKNAELLAPVAQARGNYERVFDAGRIIGTDRATRRSTSTYTVITTQSGKLVTAFPGMP